ncbi:hypothetical protein AB1Y20_000198 [Prymnesium parvum]|uniref:GST C-terminal domain-containing protein n=1 Tax=Prymnesium parvum TaxID=97485 RepID=A0AB34K7T5_PRYPA
MQTSKVVGCLALAGIGAASARWLAKRFLCRSASCRARTALDEVDAKGNFKRTAGGYTCTVAPGTRYEPEAGRYHLYVALACPWANGALAALKYKGLDQVISYSVVHPTWARTRPADPKDEHSGWHFRAPGDAAVPNTLGYGANDCDDALIPDYVNGCKSIRDLYELANDQVGKYTTPLLWDKKTRSIVCNESLEILKTFDSAFDAFAKHPERKLFKPEKKAEAEKLNEFIYPTVNNGVYRCGFATTQEAYATAHAELFASLDKLEERFSKSTARFLTGDDFTWIDLRLYMTLVRFDPVYIVYFKTSHKRLADYPNLLKFVRSCYAIPEIKEVTNIKHIKMHYFTSHPRLNTYGIIPVHNGPPLD